MNAFPKLFWVATAQGQQENVQETEKQSYSSWILYGRGKSWLQMGTAKQTHKHTQVCSKLRYAKSVNSVQDNKERMWKKNGTRLSKLHIGYMMLTWWLYDKCNLKCYSTYFTYLAHSLFRWTLDIYSKGNKKRVSVAEGSGENTFY